MKKFLLIITTILLAINSFGTHNRAGEITFKHISNLTYEFTVLTYTYSPSLADRPELYVNWGDGDTAIVHRVSKIPVNQVINKNVYKGTHTFNGAGNYVISMEDPNRNYGVINIPNSVNVPFYIETTLIINPFLGSNSSPELLYPPIDKGCIGSIFYHNPSAYDAEGDSISYELVQCLGYQGNLIPGFTFPQASNSLSIDPVTGTLTWDSPTLIGEYNIAILIKEWRNGVLISKITRDMQIDILPCNNNPPVLNQIIDTCVLVGTNLSKLISGTDQDNDYLTLTASGGPFLLANYPAIFTQPVHGTGSVSQNFYWTPICDHVRLQPYQINFKLLDDGNQPLFDIKTYQITVIAPGPLNPAAQANGNAINLSWSPASCSNAVGYEIYRHDGFIGYIPNNCETGVPAWTGYVKVGETNSYTDTTFIDDGNGAGLNHGPSYCYMIVAVFADGALSYPSIEVCASLIKDVPVITHVSVDTTSSNNGKIQVIWAKPTELNTTQHQGPFVYQIFHTIVGQPNFALVDSLMDLNDTIYKNTALNTESQEHRYYISLINNSPGNRYEIGKTQIANQVYLFGQGLDNMVKLTWNDIVPWKNNLAVVYRKNSAGIFDSIGQTTDSVYIDSNLVNGQTYCYKIKTVGAYSSPDFTNPLLNFSQEICTIPVDNQPPCPPVVSVTPDCERIENMVIWTNPNNSCANDVVGYDLFYSPTFDGDFTLIQNFNSPLDTSFLHILSGSIAGCYSVVAIDSFDNRSTYSTSVCVDIDSCELYRLPNVFTPNSDGFNDFFIPFPYDYVESVNMYIYNRWGYLVFETNDPDINWDGRDINSKNECSDGVYFYVCEVFERRLTGITQRDIKGTVTILRNN